MVILLAWPRIWTRDYREPIQLAIRVGLELGPAKYKSIAASFSNQEKKGEQIWKKGGEVR